MKYLAIDTETTGLITGKHQILEIGAIVENTDNILDFDEIPKINIILSHEEYIGSAYALGLNSEIFHILGEYEKIKQRKGYVDLLNGLEKEVNSKICSHEVAYKYLYEFLNTYYVDNKDVYRMEDYPMSPIKVTAAGKNVAGFDIPKLNLLLNFRKAVKFNSRCIDPANYCVRPNDSELPGTDECLKRVGITDPFQHRAIADSWDMICILRNQAKGFLYSNELGSNK